MKKIKIVYEKKTNFLTIMQWLTLNKIMDMKEAVNLYKKYKSPSDVEVMIPEHLVPKFKSALNKDCTLVEL